MIDFLYMFVTCKPVVSMQPSNVLKVNGKMGNGK